MAIFASQITATVAIPFDEPHTVTVRKLNARQWAEVAALIGTDQRLEWAEALVKHGLASWTYAEPVDGADLTDEALAFIAIEVAKLTKPVLFETPEAKKTAKKKG